MNSNASYHMQIEWGEQTNKWFTRASEYTGFHRQMADILLADISADETVCDLGCGAGMIDFCLCDKVRKITCVDRVPEAISLINDRIAKKQIDNMETICSDIQNLSGNWDTCIMLFVGIQPSEVSTYLKLCKKRLLIVYRGGCQIHPDLKDRAGRHKSLLPLYNAFLEAGIRCRMQPYSLEYGQPCTDLTDAYNYVTFYHKNPVYMGAMDYIHANMERTYQFPYPYYLPYQKKFGVIEINKKDNLALCD